MDRDKYLISFIKNKEILDLGFLGENKKDLFSLLHKFLLKNAKSVCGVDFHKDRINFLKKKGYDVMYDDVMTLKNIISAKRKFDVVVAGELIEHIENLGLFLDNIKNVLKKDDGVIIVTTPNMFSLRYMIRHIFLKQETPYWKNRSDEIKFGHVVGFSNMLLHNLFMRKGYKIVSHSYTIKTEYSGFKGNIEKFLSKLIPKLSPSLVYVLKLKK